MVRHKVPHMCITCEYHDGINFHCKAHDSYISYACAFEENNGCKKLELNGNYKRDGKFYKQEEGEQDGNG